MALINDHERFKNVWSGTQNVVVSIAVIVGGIWTAWTFGVTAQVDKARAELEELNQKLKTTPLVEIDLDVAQIKGLPGDRRGLIISAKFHNSGTRPVRLNLQNSPLRVVRVAVGEGQELRALQTWAVHSFREISAPGAKERSVPFRAALARGGERGGLSYYVEVEHPGIYMASFMVPTGKEEEKEFVKIEREEGVPPEEPRPKAVWVATKFFEVK